MVEFTLKTKGFEALERKFKNAPAKVRVGLRKEIVNAVINIDLNAKRIMTQKGAVDTGRARSSLHFVIEDGGDRGVVIAGGPAFDGTIVNYAQHIEFGTSRMKARPFLGPAERQEAPKLLKRAALVVGVALR